MSNKLTLMREERQKTVDEILSLESKISELKIELRGMDKMLSIAESGSIVEASAKKATKQIVLNRLEEAGSYGISTNDLVEKSKIKGEEISLSTASSLLSRFKSEGHIVSYNGKHYLESFKPKIPKSEIEIDQSNDTVPNFADQNIDMRH